MAISKTQNERPAIIDLIDSANALELASDEHTESIETLTDALEAEVSARELAVAGVQGVIGEGFSEQHTIAQSLGATNAIVAGIDGDVTALQTSFNALSEVLKFGVTEEVEVPANSSYSGSYAYTEPFPDTSESFVVLGFAGDLLQSTLEITLIDSTYSGFSYSIFNSDTDPATVTVGYLAINAG